jgi:hypothetical protein
MDPAREAYHMIHNPKSMQLKLPAFACCTWGGRPILPALDLCLANVYL